MVFLRSEITHPPFGVSQTNLSILEGTDVPSCVMKAAYFSRFPLYPLIYRFELPRTLDHLATDRLTCADVVLTEEDEEEANESQFPPAHVYRSPRH